MYLLYALTYTIQNSALTLKYFRVSILWQDSGKCRTFSHYVFITLYICFMFSMVYAIGDNLKYFSDYSDLVFDVDSDVD